MYTYYLVFSKQKLKAKSKLSFADWEKNLMLWNLCGNKYKILIWGKILQKLILYLKAMETFEKNLEKAFDQIKNTDLVERKQLQAIGTDFSFERKIVWKNAVGFLILHLMALYGLYLCFFVKSATVIWRKYLCLLKM